MTWRGVYINLDRSQLRRAGIETQLNELGLAGLYQRFSAVDGTGLAPPNGGFTAGELACYKSHLEVIRIHEGLDRWLHVIEDDILISRHAGSAIQAVTSTADCAGYDVIFTNVLLHAPAYAMAQFCRLYDESVQFDEFGAPVSARINIVSLGRREFVNASSYLINPASIAKVAALLKERLDASPFTPVDIVLSDLSLSGALSVGCTIPFFTLPRWDIQSTIQDEASVLAYAPLRIADAALYMDRDAGLLRSQLDKIRNLISPSPTSALVADAYALVLGGWLIDRPPKPAT
jgi:GR25 family glycosyltransferase involved in LPS biosynthesis